MPDLRRQRRVVYHTKMRLRAPGREKSVVARVQNLSTAGVYVTATASDLPAAGTEVLCRMLVAGERCTLKGLVAWVRPEGIEGDRDGGPGAGIQFVDVSDREAQLLARLTQPAAGDRQSVDVWFEGMGSPIKSHASITDDALSISTKLPFLRLNSPVKVSFVRRGVEEVRSGILEAVTLEPSAEDGIPRLQVTVSTPLPDSAYGTIEVPDAAAAFTPPEGMLVREPRTVVDPGTVIETPPPVLVDPAVSQPVVLPKPVLAEVDRTPRVVRQSEAITLVPPVPVVTPLSLRRETSLATKVTMGLVAASVAGVLIYLLAKRDETAPPAAPSVAVVERPKAAPVEKRSAPLAAPAAPQPAAKQPSEIIAAEVEPAAAPVEKPAAVAKPAPVEKPVVEKEPAAPPAPTLAINLVGSSRGMQFYKLADPPGLAINLPHGYPRPGASRGAVAPFKRVAVQRKGGGSHLRVYFTSEQNADVSAEGNGLRVTLRPKRQGRKS